MIFATFHLSLDPRHQLTDEVGAGILFNARQAGIQDFGFQPVDGPFWPGTTKKMREWLRLLPDIGGDAQGDPWAKKVQRGEEALGDAVSGESQRPIATDDGRGEGIY